jgi:hypothetical protein
MHYTRWRRHGDPLLTQYTPKGEAMYFYENTVLAYDGNDCLIWPYNRFPSGYGAMHNPNGSCRVSRILCEDVNGPPPTPEHEAAHSCGKGHLGCVTKRHLDWKTALQNQSDRLIHGTNLEGAAHPMAKLSDADVREIRSLVGTATHKEIAAKYGVSRNMISNILSGKNWGSVQ